MRVSIQGGSKSQKKYVRSAVKFCQKQLMPRMLDIHVNVKIADLKGKALGYCLPLVDDGERADRPRYFEVEVCSKSKLRTLLVALCHEMVHVKQYARGELYESQLTDKTRWQGKWMAKRPDYWECPWEWDAMGREHALFITWCEKNDYGKKTWTQINE